MKKKYLKKSQLKVGYFYKGECRNASVAMWNGVKFLHTRIKFNDEYITEINHPEDNNVSDVFYPFFEIIPTKNHQDDYLVDNIKKFLLEDQKDFGTNWNNYMDSIGGRRGTIEDLKNI